MPHLRYGGGVCGFLVRGLRVATQQSGSSRLTSLLKRCCSGVSWMCSASLMLSSLLLLARSAIVDRARRRRELNIKEVLHIQRAAGLQQRCQPGTAGLLGCHSEGPDEEATHTTTIPKMRHAFSSRESGSFFSPSFATSTLHPQGVAIFRACGHWLFEPQQWGINAWNSGTVWKTALTRLPLRKGGEHQMPPAVDFPQVQLVIGVSLSKPNTNELAGRMSVIIDQPTGQPYVTLLL